MNAARFVNAPWPRSSRSASVAVPDQVRGSHGAGSVCVGGTGAEDDELEAGASARRGHERNLAGIATATRAPPRRKVSSSNSARARIR